MSLNRYEQALFDYVEKNPEESRHWRAKVAIVPASAEPGSVARQLERELWDYFAERCTQVPALRDLQSGGVRRVSMLNLAEYLLRLWGPLPKPKRPPS
jgi:hypothetical protein